MCATHVSLGLPVMIRSRNSSLSSWYRCRNFNADSTRFTLCSGVSCFGTHLAHNFLNNRCSVTILCKKEQKICGKSLLSSLIVKRRFSISAFPHKLHKLVRKDGRPPTALLIVYMLSTCRKLSAPATDHLLAPDVKPIDLAQLTMNFDRRYALCIQKLYQRPHFTVDGSWNKSFHLQPLQRCYCVNSGSPASAYVMRHHYSITYYRQSLQAINGLVALGRVAKLLCGCPSYS